MKSEEHLGYEVGGIAFVGSILIGVGAGMYYDKIAIGSLLGTGIGFVLMAIFRATLKEK